MNDERREFLDLTTLPARLTVRETSWCLGFTETDITILMAAGLLKPLGKPRPTGSKYFATSEIKRLRDDCSWLARASDAVVKYWRIKNSGRTNNNAIGLTHDGHLETSV